MPRTKTTSKSSKRSRGEDIIVRPTFLNDEAEALYHSSIVMRKCIPERGFYLFSIPLHYNRIHDPIETRGWKRFTEQPEAAIVPVVREFYANAKEQHRINPRILTALVRGKNIRYDRAEINEFYGLEDIEEDEYTEWLNNESYTPEILEMLAVPGGQWNMTGDKIRTLSRSQMTPETKAWHYFISGKMMPSNHYSDATKERAFLNYAIQAGLSINVGRVIEQSIIAAFSGRATGGLGHPSLIYQLCLRAGVPTSASEEVHHPSPMIDSKLLEILDRQPPPAPAAEAAAEGDAGASSSRPARRQNRAATRATRAPAAETALPADDRSRLELVIRQQTSIRRELRIQRSRIDQCVDDQRRQFEYITQALHTLGSSSGVTMPSPLHFPVYPPPTPPGSDQEESADSASAEESAED